MADKSAAKPFNLRIPADVRAWLEAEARQNMRSLNNEIVFKLAMLKADSDRKTALSPGGA